MHNLSASFNFLKFHQLDAPQDAPQDAGHKRGIFSFNSLYRKTWVENWASRRYTMHDRFEALLRLAILPVLQAINGPVFAILIAGLIAILFIVLFTVISVCCGWQKPLILTA